MCRRTDFSSICQKDAQGWSADSWYARPAACSRSPQVFHPTFRGRFPIVSRTFPNSHRPSPPPHPTFKDDGIRSEFVGNWTFPQCPFCSQCSNHCTRVPIGSIIIRTIPMIHPCQQFPRASDISLRKGGRNHEIRLRLLRFQVRLKHSV